MQENSAAIEFAIQYEPNVKTNRTGSLTGHLSEIFVDWLFSQGIMRNSLISLSIAFGENILTQHLRIRVNKAIGELEIEGSSELVLEWWERIVPELRSNPEQTASLKDLASINSLEHANHSSELPSIFGEYYSAFPKDVSDIDKILIAAAYSQSTDGQKTFTTSNANQLLLDQGVKVSNPSQNIKRLIDAKKVFVVSAGAYRVSATGLEYLEQIKEKR